MYMSTIEAAERWGISARRVRTLCNEGKITGAFKKGKFWMIPDNAQKPEDKRVKNAENLFLKIEQNKKLLDNKRPLTQGELERLNEEFTVEYTYNSNAIEGNTLTLRETDMVLRGLTIDSKPLQEHLEAINHKEAFDYVLSLVRDNVELTENIIKQIHSLVLADKREDRGIYRHVPVKILGAAHIPVQPYEIEPKMAELLNWYHGSSDNIISKLAKFHIEFEAIHPFIDGNGRTGRLLINLELMKAGYPPIDIKFADRIAYYEAFDQYHIKGDLSSMKNLFANYLNERLEYFISILDY